MLRYADRVYGLSQLFGEVRDGRPRPRIPTYLVVSRIWVLFLARLGSLHALDQLRGRSFWRRWLGGGEVSSDSLGRIAARIEVEDLREVLGALYHRFRRNKVGAEAGSGPMVLILDGHECPASYRRSCPRCLQRRVKTAAGERIQYFHRQVTALLQIGRFRFLLDLELQQPGEDEVAAGQRLFERVVRQFPRAFDVVLADGLYARTSFVQAVRAHGKHVLVVLKENRPELLADARGLFGRTAPLQEREERGERRLWDEEGFTTWDGLGDAVRVVRSLEMSSLRRADGTEEIRVSDWFWVTTLPRCQVGTRQIVTLGHQRWAIENHGFNELGQHWHVDHMYRHDPAAILVFWLTAFLAYNLFHVFVDRRIRATLRAGHTILHWARQIAADLYQDPVVDAWAAPP